MDDDTNKDAGGYSRAQFPTLKKNFENIDMWTPQFLATATLKSYDLALEYEPGMVDPDMPASANEVITDPESRKKADKALRRNKMAMAALCLSFTHQRQMRI
mmetsp:Transcript_2660/g.3545  ORF Transcript_2660/g.3545 Transcript_2660/m.3545 type:complete len:102 (+) Transcript_2660:962-1267(+)